MRCVTVTLYAGVSEKITISDGQTITTDSSGKATATLHAGAFTFTGAISGQSYERQVSINTRDVYVMPESALYWYGNILSGDISRCYYDSTSHGQANLTKEANDFKVSTDTTTDGIGCVMLSNPIDFTGYSKLKLYRYLTTTRSSGDAWFILFGTFKKETSVFTAIGNSRIYSSDVNKAYHTFTANISSYSGEYYVAVGANDLRGSTSDSKHFKIWLE